MTQKTYEKLLSAAIARAKEGQSVILDATFAQRVHREQLKTAFEPQNVAFRFIEAQAKDDRVKGRLAKREAKADEISDARLEDFDMLTRLYEPPTELTGSQSLTVRTTSPLEETLTFALKALVKTLL